MHYFADTEFDAPTRSLISLALVPLEGASLYLADPEVMKRDNIDPWVKEHVLPIVDVEGYTPQYMTPDEMRKSLETYFQGEKGIVVHVDWPIDMTYLSELLITGPGTMIDIPSIVFQLHRVEPYPVKRENDYVQHNALCDALALREALY